MALPWAGDTISISTGSFFFLISFCLLLLLSLSLQLVIKSKDSIQESTQKPSIHTLKENTDNSFFLQAFICKTYIPTESLKEKGTEYPNALGLQSVNPSPHLCLFLCRTHVHIYSLLTEQSPFSTLQLFNSNTTTCLS